MKITETTILTEVQKAAIIGLWNREYPAQLSYKTPEAFNLYLDGLSGKQHLLLSNDADEILGWAIVFERERERWFAIILDRKLHRKGFGTMLLDRVKAGNAQLVGWVTDHERYVKSDSSPYPSPLGFYLRNGFRVEEGTRLELEHLSVVRIDWKGD
jgi:hypothetical protein